MYYDQTQNTRTYIKDWSKEKLQQRIDENVERGAYKQLSEPVRRFNGVKHFWTAQVELTNKGR